MKFISTVRQFEINSEIFRIAFVGRQKKLIKLKNEYIDNFRKTGNELSSIEFQSKLFDIYDEIVKDFVTMDARIRSKDFKGIAKIPKQLELFSNSELITAMVSNEDEAYDVAQRHIPHRSGKLQ